MENLEFPPNFKKIIRKEGLRPNKNKEKREKEEKTSIDENEYLESL